LVAIVGMPVTFALSLTFMYITGRSLNSNSLFGLVLVLGMVVDHAIVMVENVYRHIQMGKKPSTAVVDGIQEVFGPVLVATLTTIAAFLPLMLMPGIVGSFLKVIPLVVTLALVASVFEAFVILPSHAAEWLGHGETVHKTSRWMRALRERYVDALAWVIRRRYAVIVGFVALLISSGFLIPLIGLNMWSSEALPTFRVYVWMPPGTDLAETDRVMRQLEKLAMTLPKDEFNAAVTMTGYLEEEGNSERKTNVGQIIVDLAQNKDRDRTVDEIINDLRLRAAAVTGYDRLVFRKMEDGPPTGKAVEVKVKGKRFDELTTIADEMKADLAATPGVYDITDDFNLGKEEIRIIPDGDRARLHGLEVAQVAGLVRTAVNGEVATTYRDGDEDIDVIVKFADAKSYTAERIESMKVLTPSGALIPLKEVAHMQITRGYSDIPRFEGERAITVSANVDESVNSAVAVNQRVQERFKEISQRYPGYSLDFRGQFQEFNDAFSSLAKLFVLGNFLIFILLVAQFKSITQPFIIMFTVPFAFFGAMIGLLVVRAPFSVNTLYGIVALAGIVVNDSIVLVDFINQRRKAGASKWRAIMQGGRLRMRPIMLTTLTTIAGLAPMALGLGGRSETWMPLATTIVWGLATATFLTLFIIPSLYAIVDDMAFFRRRRERVEARDRDTAKQPVPARGLAPEPAD
ncbi:MAG: efflux RND transporter permease subunit, partial [Candidatus Poribacteria bacterium]|nr:efflux RND transporter permease subunit [Candidatus Poribacteria bacterium]